MYFLFFYKIIHFTINIQRKFSNELTELKGLKITKNYLRLKNKTKSSKVFIE